MPPRRKATPVQKKEGGDEVETEEKIVESPPVAAVKRQRPSASHSKKISSGDAAFSPSGLLFICIPLVVALVAAYYGGFLTVSSKKSVPMAHQRAQPPSKHKPPVATKAPPSQLAALNITSPWYEDEGFLHESQIGCGFRVVQASEIDARMFQDEKHELSQLPLLIRGLTSKWPAHERWQRPKLIELFGNKTILSGSESSIVYGGGTATMPMRLISFLASMRKPSATMPDGFTFDVGVLESIPEMRGDYRSPLIFNSWDNEQELSQHNSWHMLSLGGSRNGLPFHSHGKTWLALIHGKKRWLVYPPGYSAPADVQQQYNPLKSVYSWVQETLQLMKGLPLPPIEPADPESFTVGPDGVNLHRHERGYAPIQCLQEEGDIVYLPDGWAHMTINVGEAIGIGGQAGMTNERRLAVGKFAVAVDDHNFDGHKFAALALAHMAIEEEHRVKSHLTATNAGMVQLRDDNFGETVLDSEDTWLVQYFSHSGGDNDAVNLPDTKTWNGVASKLRGLVSVGAMNLSAESLEEHGFLRDGVNLLLSGPRARLYLGNGNRESISECARDGVDFEFTPAASESNAEGASPAGPTIDDLVEFALAGTAMRGGQLAGSAIAVTARGKRLFKEAEYHQRACLELQPLHPEGHGLLAELLGHAGLLDSMDEVIASADARFSALDPSQYSPHSFASVYHKLATVYLGKEKGAKALPLLQKALKIEPAYLPALIDTAIAHFYEHDETKAEIALRAVDKISPNHVSAAKLREAIKKNKSIKGNAARRSMMGQPNKKGPGSRGDKPNPQMSAHQARAAGARAQAERDRVRKGSAAGAGKGFQPTASHTAASMMTQMQEQLEAELDRRRALGEDVREPRRRLAGKRGSTKIGADSAEA